MAGRTRLYQRPGSPLIQGQSKTERPFWQPWLAGFAAGLVLVVGVLALLAEDHIPSVAAIAWMALPAALGALLGAYVARAWGMNRAWLAAAAGVLLACVAVWFAFDQGIPAAIVASPLLLAAGG